MTARRTTSARAAAGQLRIAAVRYAEAGFGDEATDRALRRAARAFVAAESAELARTGGLSERSLEVLSALSAGSAFPWLAVWLRPMDLGGTDGSHHSVTLQRLARRGLVERRRRATIANERGSRGSWEYRLTVAGSELASPAQPDR